MIPVADVRGIDFDARFIEACRDIGFVSITGHGFDAALFDRMRSMAKRLFELDENTKRRNRITPDNYRGFIPLGFFTPNRSEVNGDAADQYEAFKLHWECPPGHPARGECALYGSNRWLDEFPELQTTVTEYWAACDRLAGRLLDACADALGYRTDEFGSMHQAPLTNMTLLHYPPQPATSSAAGIHPHKDTNVITLLHPDPVGGLEVRMRDGRWVEAQCPPDAMLVNIGEMLELWSGGRFVATPHRVINRSGRQRYAFPYFVVPNHAVVVEPLVECVDGYTSTSMPVGELSAEVWRTNWPTEAPSASGHDLGALDRT